MRTMARDTPLRPLALRLRRLRGLLQLLELVVGGLLLFLPLLQSSGGILRSLLVGGLLRRAGGEAVEVLLRGVETSSSSSSVSGTSIRDARMEVRSRSIRSCASGGGENPPMVEGPRDMSHSSSSVSHNNRNFRSSGSVCPNRVGSWRAGVVFITVR